MKYKVIHGNVLWQCWMWPWCAINLHFCRQGPPVNVTKASAKKEIQIKYKDTSVKKKEIKLNIKRPMPKKNDQNNFISKKLKVNLQRTITEQYL